MMKSPVVITSLTLKPKERSEKEWLDLMEDEEGSDNGVASLGLED
jgi:hypothetical protein